MPPECSLEVATLRKQYEENCNTQTRSYNQQYNINRPKYRKYILKVYNILQRVQTSTC